MFHLKDISETGLQVPVLTLVLPLKFFFLTAFLPNKLNQMLLCNHSYILYTSFDVYKVKFGGGGGCHLGMGVFKENGRGVGEIPWLLFCPFLKYLTRYMFQTSYVDENHHFLIYSAKSPAKNSCFYKFLAKNWFWLILVYIFKASKFLRACWLYDVHSEVIWISMVLILVLIDWGSPYLYTGSK